LTVGQAESSATELLLEDAVLLAEVLDDRILLAADPAGKGGNEDLSGLKDGGRSLIVARQWSTRQLSLAVRVGPIFPRIGSVELSDTTGCKLEVPRRTTEQPEAPGFRRRNPSGQSETQT